MRVQLFFTSAIFVSFFLYLVLIEGLPRLFMEGLKQGDLSRALMLILTAVLATATLCFASWLNSRLPMMLYRLFFKEVHH